MGNTTYLRDIGNIYFANMGVGLYRTEEKGQYLLRGFRAYTDKPLKNDEGKLAVAYITKKQLDRIEDSGDDYNKLWKLQAALLCVGIDTYEED